MSADKLDLDAMAEDARAQLARLERCPNGCGHTICELSQRPALKPGEAIAFRVVR